MYVFLLLLLMMMNMDMDMDMGYSLHTHCFEGALLLAVFFFFLSVDGKSLCLWGGEEMRGDVGKETLERRYEKGMMMSKEVTK